MIDIKVSDEIETVCPSFVGAAVFADVENSAINKDMWNEIESLGKELKSTYSTETIKEIPGIMATRRVYRACGKDPSRYRPSAEALIRRILLGKGLYQIDTLVDLINLASMKYGYSIGGFDADKISGKELVLGIGQEGEPYRGIGRGMINIAGLPVYRDSLGGIGTPTSDNERTKLGLETKKVLILINGYDGNKNAVEKNASYILELLEKYASGKNGGYYIYE